MEVFEDQALSGGTPIGNASKKMTTRERLLSFLEAQKGNYVSGEALAESLQVSRTAVWKAIQTLRLQGYPIDSVTNRGYCLSLSSDVLSKEGIHSLLSPSIPDLNLFILDEIGSTNAYLRQLAGEGAPHKTVVIAGKQTAGRGRMGRSFFSPSDTGVYLSLLLKPSNELPSQSVKMTTMAAVAACEALEQIGNVHAQIKWVNDIFLKDRKVAGILTEGSFNMETGMLDFMIVGIGFNVYPPEEGFPEDITHTAGSIFQSRQPNGKNRLVSAFLNSFFHYYERRDRMDHSEPYRRRSLILGKEIEVISGDLIQHAIARDIDEECRLIAEFDNGEIQTLSSGEVRIRPLLGEK